MSTRIIPALTVALLATSGHAAPDAIAKVQAAHPPSANLPLVQLAALPPSTQQAWVLRRLTQQRSRTLATTGDVTGPTLSRFENRPSVRAGEPLSVRIALDDDLSGVKQFVAYAVGGGGRFQLTHTLAAPDRHPNAPFAVDLPRDLPSGQYFFDFAFAMDEAGNVAVFDAASLAAAGARALLVSNPNRGDSQPPALTEGRIRTPQLSLSATSPGTDHPAYAKVTLSMTDSGELSVAGVKSAGMDLCLEDMSSCLTLLGQATAPGQSSLVMTLAGQPALLGATAGTYRACSIYATDWVGQTTGVAAAWCGGDTDLGALLPAGDVIRLTP